VSAPLVSCVCPTTTRRAQWLPLAIGYFMAQSYAARELLIVVDQDGYVPDVPADPRIQVLYSPRGITLGAKRNFACQHSAGLIAHFDDDDFSAPGRLEDQVTRLIESGKALTGYARMKFTDGKQWWRYEDETWPLGTSLLYRRDWWERHPFPPVAVASDTPFIKMARAARQVAVAECGDMMVARIHPDSTNKRRLQDGWALCEPARVEVFA
jgi:hypothetical protein